MTHRFQSDWRQNAVFVEIGDRVTTDEVFEYARRIEAIRYVGSELILVIFEDSQYGALPYTHAELGTALVNRVPNEEKHRH